MLYALAVSLDTEVYLRNVHEFVCLDQDTNARRRRSLEKV